MTGDGAVMKRIVRKGDGEFPIDCPLEDSRVRVHYRQAWPWALFVLLHMLDSARSIVAAPACVFARDALRSFRVQAEDAWHGAVAG